MKIEMDIEEGRWLAHDLLTKMRPYCERAEVAGSIRRGKEIVGDVEVVCIPRREYDQGLFGPGELRRNELFEASDWAADIRWIKPGTSDLVDWAINPAGKYWRGLIHNKIPLDIFLVYPDNWGIQYLIRTGSRDFSERVVTALRYQKQTPMRDGYLHQGLATDAPILPTPEEQDVFNVLGWEFIEPKERT